MRCFNMMDILWWALNTAIGIGTGFYVLDLQGALFMAVVGGLGGVFLLFEKATHS